MTGSLDALDLVSRRRPAASLGQTHPRFAAAPQAREGSGEVWVTPAHTAVGPGLRGRRGSPDGGCSHPAQSA